MKTVTLTATESRDFLAGSDGAYYTPVQGVEARCRWCGKWGHGVGLYHRQVLFTRKNALICSRHIRPDDESQKA